MATLTTKSKISNSSCETLSHNENGLKDVSMQWQEKSSSGDTQREQHNCCFAEEKSKKMAFVMAFVLWMCTR